MRTSRLFVLSFLALLAIPGQWAQAQDVSVRAFLSHEIVGLNQAFTLSVELSGSQQLDANPVLPDIDEYAQFLNSSTSSQMNIVNSRMSVTYTVQYRFQAIKEGTYTIPSFEVASGGQRYTTDPLTLEISAAPPPAGQNTQRGGNARTTESGVSSEDLFLEATANKTTVYLGEPAIVEYRIYTRVNVSGYEITRQPSTAGFWSEEYPQPSSLTATNTVRDGRQYVMATIKKLALFPTGTGTKTIDPMTMQAQIRVQGSRDPFRDFFGGGSLFGRNVSQLISSAPIELEVLPLPAAGRPSDFSGFVGNVDISTSLDMMIAETNEALTLTVRIAGDGNIRTIPEPEIEFPGDFEVYPPEITEQVTRGDNRVSGSKTYEYVLIPRAPGRRTIPSVRLNFFDPSTASYRTDVTAPIEIDVTGNAIDVPGVTSRARGEIATLREDIRFIQIETPSFRPTDRSLFGSAGFWLVFLVPVVAVSAALGVRRHQSRLEGDVAYARRRRASRAARKRLAGARNLLGADTQKEFYAEVGSALEGFLGDKLNIAAAGMIRDDVIDLLNQHEVSQELIDEYFGCLEHTDRQRFAPAEADENVMSEFLTRVEAAMSALDRGLSV
ncbi:BatD family protein [Gemmatimonadota bacterium]